MASYELNRTNFLGSIQGQKADRGFDMSHFSGPPIYKPIPQWVILFGACEEYGKALRPSLLRMSLICLPKKRWQVTWKGATAARGD